MQSLPESSQILLVNGLVISEGCEANLVIHMAKSTA